MTEDTEAGSRTAAQDAAAPAVVRVALRALAFVTLLGILSLLVASATLIVYGFVETAMQVVRLTVPGAYAVTNRDIFLSSIKLIDLVLLAVIMQVIGIGLYSLLLNRPLPVPRWLLTTDIDELKNKLAGIVAIMLAVSFLEQVFYWGSERNLLPLGIAVAAVIATLSYFIRGYR